MPNMADLGLFAIDGTEWGRDFTPSAGIQGAVARMKEVSKGKDTTIGHWEIAGVVSDYPLPTFPNGFPQELIQAFEQATGRESSAISHIPGQR